MAYAQNDGHKLWYDVQGTGEPLTLIGGFALLHDQFELCLPNLHEHGYQTINWNYRGSGKSDWTLVRPYCIEDWVEDLRAVLDDAGIEKTTIWATSTSSVIGTRFAAKYPDRVNALLTYPWYKADRYWIDLFDAVDGICRMFLSNQSNRQATEPHDKCPWYGHDVVQYGQRHGKQAQPEVRICMEKRLGYELCQNKDDNRCDARLYSQG